MLSAPLVWLEELAAADVNAVGGKARSLARMRCDGLPVPRAFVLTIAAIEAHQRAALPWLDAALRNAAGDDQLAAVRARAAAALARAPLAPDLAAAVGAAYHSLTTAPDGAGATPRTVVVRSSGAAEDGVEASFAGQYESVLGIRDELTLHRAVAHCVASAWSARAAHYREHISGNSRGMTALAVIVQEQIAADVSGVMFTTDPLGRHAGALVIMASYGLGDAIVSGDVTPDMFVVDASGAIRERQLGEKALMSVDTGAGCEKRDVPPAQRARFCLNDADIERLAHLGRRLERLFGRPQDIEWGLTAAGLHVFQARPVTTAATAVAADDSPAPPLGLVRRQFLTHSPMLANFADHFPDPLTALDFTTTVRAGLVGIGALFGFAGLRMKTPDQICPPTADGAIRFEPGPPRPTLALAALPFRLRAAYKLDAIAEWTRHDRPRIQAALETGPAMATTDLARLDVRELIAQTERLQGVFEQAAAVRFRKYFSSGLLHTLIVRLLMGLVTTAADRRAVLRTLYLAIPHHTAAMNADLMALTAVIEASPQVAALFRDNSPSGIAERMPELPEAAEFRTAFAAFLARYGSRSAAGMVPVVSHPTWAETPDIVLGLLQALLRQRLAHEDSGAADARTFAEAQSQTEALLGRGWGGWLRLDRIFAVSLARARHYLEVREASLHEAEVRMAGARALAIELGRRFARRGLLRDAEEIFHVRLEELGPAERGTLAPDVLRARVARRARQHRGWREAAARGRNWARIATGLEPWPPVATAAAAGAAEAERLTGLAASPGRASGPVRLVLTQREFHKLQPGDVLVCPATAPAWTPLFHLASAVVTDVGGPLSHAAIVARELGIPAVLGTGRATTAARDGQTVLVDGTAGLVVLDARSRLG